MDSPTSITDQTPKEKPIVVTSSGKKSFFKYSFVNPKILGVMTVLLLLVGGVGTGVYLIQKPQQTTSQASLDTVNLSFKPEEIQTNAGSDFAMDVFANAGGYQITGVDLNIKFDPKAVTLKSITPKDFLPKILVPPKIASNSASISLGTEGTAIASGSGVIASLLFSAKKEGTQSASQITFDPTGTKIRVLNGGTDNNNVFGVAQININEASASASPSPSPSGNAQLDFNSDGQINSLDLSFMYSAWGTPQTSTQKRADINSDGVVNGIDYSSLLVHFKQ